MPAHCAPSDWAQTIQSVEQVVAVLLAAAAVQTYA